MPRHFFSILVSIFSLLANGSVFACVEEMANDIGMAHGADYGLPDTISVQDSYAPAVRTATPRWIDCRSWCDFDQPRLSAGKFWEKTVTAAAIVGFPPSKNVRISEIHPVSHIRQPPPNPPNDRNYVSLVGIVKNLN